jgi:hypothetical protein
MSPQLSFPLGFPTELLFAFVIEPRLPPKGTKHSLKKMCS